jgi:hypothetical protein
MYAVAKRLSEGRQPWYCGALELPRLLPDFYLGETDGGGSGTMVSPLATNLLFRRSVLRRCELVH